ncbi:MAG: hypothetical protein B6D55_05275 [Candidatus Omnitrophica bacterium 4484_70.2]|nr:MAG: hypothetical protein B6D55_05275 [Candidatus Omnitrophica bacterium 4484_70.2]
MALEIAQRIMFGLILFFQGITMYFFTYHFLNVREKHIAALVSSIFYMFNPWFLGNWWTGNFFFNWGVLFLPLALWVFMEALENKLNLFKKALLLALICTFMLTPHIQHFFLLIYPLFLYLFFYLITKRSLEAFLYAMKFLFISVSIFFVLNLFWIIPAIGSLTTSCKYLSILSPLRGFRDSLHYIHLIEYIRLLGMGIYNPSFGNFYSFKIGCFTSFFLTIFVFSTLLSMRKDRNVLFFIISAFTFTLIPVLIAKVWIIQDIYIKLINVPIVGIVMFPRSLRFPQLAVLPYSFLIGLSIALLLSKMEQWRNYFKCLFLLIFISIVLVNVYPMVGGDMGGHFRPVKIPVYYKELEGWVKRQVGDFKLFITPHAYWWSNIKYTWTKNIVRHTDFIPVFYIPKASIQKLPGTGFDKGIIGLADLSIHNSPKVSKILALLNVKYIVHRKDVEYFSNILLDFEPLDRQIKFKKSIGRCDFYKVSEEYFLPHIYPSITPTLATGDIDTLMPMTETKYLDNKPVLLFTEQNETFGLLLMADRNKAHSLSFIVHRGESFVFKDSMPEDLAIDATAYSLWLIADSKKQDKADGSWLIADRFEVKKAGVYEIWMENRNHQRDTNQYEYTNKKKWNIEVDGKEIAYSFWFLADSNKAQKYIKVGEVELEEGKHKIEVCSSLFVAHGKDKKIKLILVSKKEREKVEKEIWERINQPETEVAYIFSKDNGKFWVP